MVSITWQIWVNTSSGDLSASICRWNQKCQSYNVYCGTHTHTNAAPEVTSTGQNTISPVIKFVQCDKILEALNMQQLRLHNNTAFVFNQCLYIDLNSVKLSQNYSNKKPIGIYFSSYIDRVTFLKASKIIT